MKTISEMVMIFVIAVSVIGVMTVLIFDSIHTSEEEKEREVNLEAMSENDLSYFSSGTGESLFEDKQLAVTVDGADDVFYVFSVNNLRELGEPYESFETNPNDKTFKALSDALSERSFMVNNNQDSYGGQSAELCFSENYTCSYLMSDHMDTLALRYIDVSDDQVEVLYESGEYDYIAGSYKELWTPLR